MISLFPLLKATIWISWTIWMIPTLIRFRPKPLLKKSAKPAPAPETSGVDEPTKDGEGSSSPPPPSKGYNLDFLSQLDDTNLIRSKLKLQSGAHSTLQQNPKSLMRLMSPT